MMLAHLPPEILLHIFDHLGPEFFRHDVGRLAVSKWWYHDYAWPTLVKHLKLSVPESRHRGEARSSLEAFTRDETIVLRAQPHTTAITLTLANFDPSNDSLKHDATEYETDFHGWVAEAKSSLAKLVAKQRQQSQLQHLEIHLRVWHGWYPLADPLSDLLSTPRLTSLHFDAAGSVRTTGDNGHRVKQDKSGFHFCPVINALLPTLRQLRISMDFICERLLAPPAEGTALDLEEVIIKLTREERRQNPWPRLWVGYCQPPLDIEYITNNNYEEFPKEEVQGWATALASRLKKPRMVRVIWTSNPSFRSSTRYSMNITHGYDALRGERLRLKGYKWDAEATVLE